MDTELYFGEEESEQINQMMDVARGLLADQTPVICSECFYFCKDRTCRRHAPSVLVNGGLPMTMYPRVQPNDLSCGEAVKGQRIYPDDK